MTIEELNAALVIKKKINRLKGDLEDKRTSCGKIPEIRVQGKSGTSAAQLAAELSEEITVLEKKLEIEQEIIRRQLEKVDLDETERKLMVLRYVRCYQWEDIKTVLCYTVRWMFTIHEGARNKALKST